MDCVMFVAGFVGKYCSACEGDVKMKTHAALTQQVEQCKPNSENSVIVDFFCLLHNWWFFVPRQCHVSHLASEVNTDVSEKNKFPPSVLNVYRLMMLSSNIARAWYKRRDHADYSHVKVKQYLSSYYNTNTWQPKESYILAHFGICKWLITIRVI